MSGTRAKGPSWGTPKEETVEKAPVRMTQGWSEMGRSGGYAECPFCGTEVRVYWWSLAGCGKRCPCGALLGQLYAIHWRDKA